MISHCIKVVSVFVSLLLVAACGEKDGPAREGERGDRGSEELGPEAGFETESAGTEPRGRGNSVSGTPSDLDGDGIVDGADPCPDVAGIVCPRDGEDGLNSGDGAGGAGPGDPPGGAAGGQGGGSDNPDQDPDQGGGTPGGGEGPGEGPADAPDYPFAFLRYSLDGTLDLLADLEGDPLLSARLPELGKPVYSPDGDRIALLAQEQRAEPRLKTIDPTGGSEAVWSFPGGRSARHMSWMPVGDEDKLYYVAEQERTVDGRREWRQVLFKGKLLQEEVKDLGSVLLTEWKNLENMARFAGISAVRYNGGIRLAFSLRNEADGNYAVWVADPTGKSYQSIASWGPPAAGGASDLLDPSLSPDGERLAYVKSVEVGKQVFVCDLEEDESGKIRCRGGDGVQLTRAGQSGHPCWTADGEFLLVEGKRPAEGGDLLPHDILLVAADGSGEEWNLTNTPDKAELFPTCSP